MIQHSFPTRRSSDLGQPVRSWSFADAFPIKWAGPNLNASSNQVATETLEIVHAGLQVQAKG